MVTDYTNPKQGCNNTIGKKQYINTVINNSDTYYLSMYCSINNYLGIN